jgi:hypothetical protein
VPLERDDVDRELEVPGDERFARVAAAVLAAVLRFVAARLRVAAPLFAAVERFFTLPRARFSIVSASERSSSTVV